MNLDWSVVWDARYELLDGALITVKLTAISMFLGIIGGGLFAAFRLSGNRALAWPIGCFVDFIRTTPIVLQIYWSYYVLPVLLDVRLGAFTTAILALAINVSAYNSEIFRAGIVSIRKGQINAGLALGMSHLQMMWHIVIPQATRRIMPALANIWVSLFKSTALVSTIAIPDLAYAALKLRVETFRTLEFLTAMAVLYWVMGYPQAKLVDWFHRRFKVDE